MARSVLLHALVAAACRSRILPIDAATRLAEAGERAGIATPAQARSWLRCAGVCTPAIASRLSDLLPPSHDTCGPWQLLAHLADGGMGSVWLASGATVPAAAGAPPLAVVKTIQASRRRGPAQEQAEFSARFAREVRIMRELRHPHIVRLLDAGEIDGTAYLALEYLPGGDLRDRIAAHALPEASALALLIQVAQALEAAHALQVVHRDLKPANILLADPVTAKLGDFGIARSTAEARTALTRDGTVMGSPHYMAPEQVLGEGTLDIRADVYALGAVLWTCLAGATPFRGTLQEVLHQQVITPCPDVRTAAPHVTTRTAAIVMRAMAKRREDRYADPAELRAALQAALAQAPAQAPAAPGVPPRMQSGHSAQGAATVTLAPTSRTLAGLDSAEALLAALAPSSEERAGALGGDTTATLRGVAPPPEPLRLRAPGAEVVLWARRRLVLGAEASAAVAVRIAAAEDDAARISRQHAAVWFDPRLGRFVLADLASANGTWLDGVRLGPSEPVVLGAPTQDLCLAQRVRYRLQVVPDPRGVSGQEAAAPMALLMQAAAGGTPRIDALVVGTLALGGSGMACTLPGVPAGAGLACRWDGGWRWRVMGTDAWRTDVPATAQCGPLAVLIDLSA